MFCEWVLREIGTCLIRSCMKRWPSNAWPDLPYMPTLPLCAEFFRFWAKFRHSGRNWVYSAFLRCLLVVIIKCSITDPSAASMISNAPTPTRIRLNSYTAPTVTLNFQRTAKRSPNLYSLSSLNVGIYGSSWKLVHNALSCLRNVLVISYCLLSSFKWNHLYFVQIHSICFVAIIRKKLKT